MPTKTETYLCEVPTYEVRDGNMHVHVGEVRLCMALTTFRKSMARAQRVLDEHDARCADVVPIRDHAAQS